MIVMHHGRQMMYGGTIGTIETTKVKKVARNTNSASYSTLSTIGCVIITRMLKERIVTSAWRLDILTGKKNTPSMARRSERNNVGFVLGSTGSKSFTN